MENEIIDFGSWNIPSSWDEVTLKQYQEIERFYEDNEDSTFDVRKVLHILCNKSIDEVNALPVEFTEKILNILQFLSEQFTKVEATNKIVINNVKYQINVFEKLKTGEYVATDTIIKSDKHNYAAMLAILCRKPSELYDSKFEAEVLEDRIKMFEEQPITKIKPLIDFFLLCYMQQAKTIQLYSQIKDMYNLIHQNILTSKKSGALSALFTKWQMRKLKKLEKSINSI